MSRELGVRGFKLVEEIPRHYGVIVKDSYTSNDTNVRPIRE
jgi:hypothetical protein